MAAVIDPRVGRRYPSRVHSHLTDRSLITEPEANADVERGELTIRGVAWSGAAPIARVDVSVNGGPWHEARLVGERKRAS